MTNTTTTADKGELPGAKEPRFTFSKEWCLRMAELDEGDECGAGVETLPSPLHLQVAAIAVKYCHCKNPESTTLDERYDITKFDCVEDVLSFAQELVRTFGRPADKGEQECREAFEHLYGKREAMFSPFKTIAEWDVAFSVWQAAWNRRPTNEGQADPMEWPLPCDIKIGAGTIKAGVHFKTLLLRLQVLDRLWSDVLKKDISSPEAHALRDALRVPEPATNEGQDGLTDEVIESIASKCWVTTAVIGGTTTGFAYGQFARDIARHLSSKKATPAEVRSELTIADYEEVLADNRRLTRELDVIWNGEEGAAQQASLCDIVGQIKRELPELRALNQRLAVKEGEAVAWQPQYFRDGYWVNYGTPRHTKTEAKHQADAHPEFVFRMLPLYTHPVSDDQQAKDAALEKLMVELLSLGSNADRASSYEETCAIDDRISYVKAQIRALTITKQEEV